MNEMVKIHIKATNQYTTATWKLEGYGNDDIWVCVLENIADFQWMTFWNYSSVKIEFSDGRIKEKMFYYDSLRERLTQVDTDGLEFWISKENKESEEKSMLHNVTVKHEENKVLEEFWVMYAMKNEGIAEYNQKTGVSKVLGVESCIVDKKELKEKPNKNEIAQFLSDSKADFVSVVQNYRFESELPF